MSTLPDPLPTTDPALREPESDFVPSEMSCNQGTTSAVPQMLDSNDPGFSPCRAEESESIDPPSENPTVPALEESSSAFEPPFFDAYAQPLPPPPRFPNVLDVALVVVLLLFGFFCSGALMAAALHFHLWGVSTVKGALNDIHYTLGSQAVWYIAALAGCLLLFPMIWHTGFFAGIEWRATEAIRLRRRLFLAAFGCFILALVDGFLIPGPDKAPIDEVFRMPGAAWLLFAFGVTLAPFIEELGFRGFLLPALCTAWDWTDERIHQRPAPEPGADGRTQWSVPAMVAASLLTSIPFALMHAEQTAWSFGPFILLVCVSLVLCWVRLSTRSLAASTMVHASYNLLLFVMMALGTGGFRHLERL